MTFVPGMAVVMGGVRLRVLKVHDGDYLCGPDVELLVIEEKEDAKPFWTAPYDVTVEDEFIDALDLETVDLYAPDAAFALYREVIRLRALLGATP